MDERYITVTIDPKAKGFTVDLEGFHGQGCRAIADAFQTMGPVIREEEKPEIYENHNQNQLRQGM